MTDRRLRHLLAVLLVLGGLAIAMNGCGVPQDSSPREITDRAVQRLVSPSTTAAPPVTSDQDTREVSYYFVRDGRLIEVHTALDADPTLGQAMRVLLDGPTERDAAKGLSTSIPPGTDLLGVRHRGRILTLNLSGAMSNIASTAEREAFAQLAYTALGFPDVKKVRFEVDGKPVSPSTDEGNLTAVDANSYDPPLNPQR